MSYGSHAHLMTSLMLLMLACIVLLSLKIFATEESLSSPCKVFDVSNSSMLSLFRLTVDFSFNIYKDIMIIIIIFFEDINEHHKEYVYLQNDEKFLMIKIVSQRVISWKNSESHRCVSEVCATIKMNFTISLYKSFLMMTSRSVYKI